MVSTNKENSTPNFMECKFSSAADPLNRNISPVTADCTLEGCLQTWIFALEFEEPPSCNVTLNG